MQSQTYNYKVVRQFAIMTVVWGIVGMLVGVIAVSYTHLDVYKRQGARSVAPSYWPRRARVTSSSSARSTTTPTIISAAPS